MIAPEKMYNLVWIVNGKIKETIMWNKPIGLCRWKKKQVATTTHKTGSFKTIPVN